MRFTIVRDPTRIARIRERLAHRDEQQRAARGGLVRYQMPPLPNAFPQLSRILDSSAHVAQFVGVYYHIARNQRKIALLLPAAEYPGFVFRAVADRRYALELGLGRLRELERWIHRYYGEIREPALRTEQPSSGVVGKVYALKAEVSNILVLVRGTLDTIAALLHFLYGPSSPRFASFAAFMTYLHKRYAAGADVDPGLRAYIEEHFEWFRILREYHDYVTHYGLLDVTFYEPEEGLVRTYLQDAMEVHEVVAPVLTGLDSFCEFIDQHFAARITAAARSSGRGSSGTART